MNDIDAKTFWQRVKTLAKKQNITLAQIAIELGYNYNSISVMINRNSLPDIAQAYKISQILNTSVQYLITGIEQKTDLQIVNQIKNLIDNYLFTSQ